MKTLKSIGTIALLLLAASPIFILLGLQLFIGHYSGL